MKMLAAGGFKDITRIASSSPEMWEQICMANSGNISEIMDTFIRLLEECRERYKSGFNKTFREMTTEEFSREVLDYMTQLNLIETRRDTVLIRPVAGKIAGKYPADFAAE